MHTPTHTPIRWHNVITNTWEDMAVPRFHGHGRHGATIAALLLRCENDSDALKYATPAAIDLMGRALSGDDENARWAQAGLRFIAAARREDLPGKSIDARMALAYSRPWA